MRKSPLLCACAAAVLSASATQSAAKSLFGATAPLNETQLSQVRGGFRIGAFDMAIGVTITTTINDRLVLASQLIIDANQRTQLSVSRATNEAARRVAEATARVEEGLAQISEITAVRIAGAAAAATTATPPRASSAVSVSAPTVTTAAAPAPSASAPAPSTPSANTAIGIAAAPPEVTTSVVAAEGPVLTRVTAPGLSVEHVIDGLPRAVVVNQLSGLRLEQSVLVDVTINNFRDLTRNFRAARQAIRSIRAARALGTR